MTELGIACGPLEVRSAGYTSLILRGLHAAAEGDVAADVDRLAVVEGVRGLWRRGLSACTVTPARAAAVLTRALRSQMADCLLSSDGAYVAALDVQAGRLALHTAADWTVYGDSPEPDAWRYDVYLPTPTGGHVRRMIPRAGVLHAQWRADTRQPWLAAGPWHAADATGTLAARVERVLSRECNSPVGTAIPIPMSMADDAQDALEAALSALRGGTALVPTTSGGHGAGQHDAPRTDWRAQRIGPAPAREIVDLRTRTCTDLATAAGIPPALLDPGADATATREGLRAFAVAGVQPVIAQIAELASELLEIEVSITVPSGWLDVQARARAFRALAGRDGNLEPAAARQIVGL